MAEITNKAAAANDAAIPGVGSASDPTRKARNVQRMATQKAAKKGRALRVVGGAAAAAGTVGGTLGGPWGRLVSLAGAAASSAIERKLGTEQAPAPAADPAATQPGAPASSVQGGTEAKLAALMGPPASSASGAVAVGSKLVGGVLVSPEPYDSETGPRLAVVARVFGAANALELAVARIIDVSAGQLLTFITNRGYR